MDAKRDAIYLMGDLSDPWVASIGDGLPARFRVTQFNCPDELPERAFDPTRPPLMIVMHRTRLTAEDARRVAGWRGLVSARQAPGIVLCTSPYLRYDQLERWRSIVDVMLPEATVRDVLPARAVRLADGRPAWRARSDGPTVRVEVSGGLGAISAVVCEACAGAGYRAQQVGDLLGADHSGAQLAQPASSERVLTIWDVPVLEPGWPEQLERRARLTGPVIALLGFADRASVSLARSRGAQACLELPFDLDDLLFLIDRVVETRPIESWPAPARFEPPHQLPPRPRRRAARSEAPSAGPPWSDHDHQPTIP
jgi:hypothetical protein